jgi:flagellar hook-length control protein FliK
MATLLLAEVGRRLQGDAAAGQASVRRDAHSGIDGPPVVFDAGADGLALADTRPGAARRLEASLLQASEAWVHARTWRIDTTTPGTTNPDAGPRSDSQGPLPTGPARDQSAEFALGLGMAAPARAGETAASADASATNSASHEPAVVPQIVKAIRLQWRQGLGEARIRLEPEHLGEVQISMRVQGGAVTAVVQAENPTVQGWIEARHQELRSALSEQGLRLQRFEVVVDPEGRRQGRDTPDGRLARHARGAGDADAEFVIDA